MKKKPVILQVLPALISGGVERGTIDIAKAIVDAGWTSLVASAGGVMVPQLEVCGACHVVLPLASKNPLQMYLNRQRLIDLIRRYQVDIIHARSRAPAWSAYFAAKKTGCHFVTTWHGTYNLGGSLKRKYNNIMGKGEKVIAVSQFIKDHILAHYPVDAERIEVIHRGSDLEKFSPEKVNPERIVRLAKKYGMEHDKPIILLPARMTQWKGHLFLLDSLAQIKHIPFLCVFAGKTDDHPHYLERISQRVNALGLSGQVQVIKEVSDMPALYALADVVVSASLNPEAFGRVAAEAQAMKRLLVATNHGGSKETVISGKTGWLVESNDVLGMTQALEAALTISPEKRLVMVNEARAHIQEHFSLEKMQEQTLALYEKVLT